MRSAAQESYLVAEVMTATPQKLQLMLIEAAIRSAQRAREKWQAREDGQAGEALIHAQDIMGELLAGLNRDADPKLCAAVAAVYLFVFRSLMEAHYRHDEKKLNDAIRILEIERDTWRQVCQQGASETPAHADADARPSTPPPPPHAGNLVTGAGLTDDVPPSGFSLEA